ncbi:MAG: MFS transporter [Elainellaceae cyanobacterium]
MPFSDSEFLDSISAADTPSDQASSFSLSDQSSSAETSSQIHSESESSPQPDVKGDGDRPSVNGAQETAQEIEASSQTDPKINTSNGQIPNGQIPNGQNSNGSQTDQPHENGSLPANSDADPPATTPLAEPAAAFGDGSELEVGFLPVLRNFNFLALWSGQVFSQIADKVYLVLMIALISSRFQASGQSISGWVSSLMIIFTVPAVLFGFAAGVFVDRWQKKVVLVSTNLLRGGLVFLLPMLVWLTADWQPVYGLPVGFFVLLGITFLVSTLTQFFAPAEQAVIPLVVEKKHLLSANSLYTTTMMASVIVGFALGEPLLELADAIAARFMGDLDIGKELLVGSCYALAGLILFLIRPQERQKSASQAKSHIWADMKDGLRYLRDHDKVRAALIQLVILFSVFAALAVLAVRLAELIPTIDSDQFGFLLAAAGVGMAIGAALVGQFGQQFRRSHLSLVGSAGMALCLAILSFQTQNLWPALILIGLLGIFAALVGIPMQTTIQAETPERMRGKVFGLQNNAVNIALSLPLALAGIAETLFGLSAVLISLSVIILAGGLLTWYSSPMRSSRTTSQSG